MLAGPARSQASSTAGAPGICPEGGEGDLDVDAGVGAGPVGDHLGADEELAALLEGVVVALRDGAVVFGAALLAEGLQHRGDRRRALGGQVAAVTPAPSMVVSSWRKRSSKPSPVVVGVLGSPGFVGGLGDDPQPVQVRARGGGLEEDLVGVSLQRPGRRSCRSRRPSPAPTDRDGAVGGGVVRNGWRPQEAHRADGGLGVFAAQAGAAASQAAVVAYPSASWAESASNRRSSPFCAADSPDGSPRSRPAPPRTRPRPGPGGRGVEVVDGRPGRAQRLGDALRRAWHVTGIHAHPESPLPGAVLCPDVPPRSTQLPLAASPHLWEYI